MPDSPPSWPVRTVDASELLSFARVVGTALLSTSDPAETEKRFRDLTELDRTIGAYDGDQLIGTTTVRSMNMTLPGGPRAVAGVSAVGVLPTHRRRGVLSALMRRQLADIHERGEDVATLFASEGAIYGRFGYGPAARAHAATLRPAEVALRPDAPRDPALRLRLTTPDDARETLAAVHKAAALERVGEFQRDSTWWDLILHDDPQERNGYSARRCAVVEDDAGPLGYLTYRVKQHWDEFHAADGRVQVEACYATAPAAHTLLWEHVLTLDLVSVVEIGTLAPDAPLYRLLADSYRARTLLQDNLWVRLVDVAAALERRSYAAPVDVVLEVTDRSCPWNAGRWRLAADTEAARCVAAETAPDIRLDVAQLGAAYLGDTRLGGDLAAGLLTEETPGAVARLDTALTRSDLPHCGEVF